MTTEDTFLELEDLKDVTEVESETAERTYIVWVYGYAEPSVLELIEQISGWSFTSFYGSNGSDVGLCYSDMDDAHSEFEYEMSVTAFNIDQYEEHERR